MLTHGVISLVTLGAVFLAVTGGEALYADLGHFGRKPIRLAWFGFVLPALVHQLFRAGGAGARAIRQAISNPFYLLAPESVLLPLVVLATAASIIASQAVITGASSLTRQAVQLGLLPRFASAPHLGLPCRADLFASCEHAAADRRRAAGRVCSAPRASSPRPTASRSSTTMLVDGVMCALVMSMLWRWKPWLVVIAAAPLILVDATFFGANLLKLLDGAWLPLLFGAIMITIIWTWRRGTAIAMTRRRGASRFRSPTSVRSLEKRPPPSSPAPRCS